MCVRLHTRMPRVVASQEAEVARRVTISVLLRPYVAHPAVSFTVMVIDSFSLVH